MGARIDTNKAGMGAPKPPRTAGAARAAIKPVAKRRVVVVLPLNEFDARRTLVGIQTVLANPDNSAVNLSLKAGDAGNGGCEVQVVDTSHQAFSGDLLQACLGEHRTHFAILCFCDPRLAQLIEKSGIPHVSIAPSPASAGTDLAFDNRSAGKMLADHFIENGLTNFAFYGSMHLAHEGERFAGFTDRVAQAAPSRKHGPTGHLPAAPVQHLDGGALAPSQHAALAKWINTLPRPVAIACATDLQACELAAAACQQGLKIPQEVAIASIGNDPSICRHCFPPLTSVDLDCYALGVRAAQAAMRSGPIDGSQPKPVYCLPAGPLIIRESSDAQIGFPRHVADALKYIRTSAGADINVKSVAGYMGISRRKLERDFMRYVGRSPHDEINRARVETIKSMLKGNAPLRKIAAVAGFSSAQYMATFFAAATGMTVQSFRTAARHREGADA